MKSKTNIQITTALTVACSVLLGLSGCQRPEGPRTSGASKNYIVVSIDDCEYIECDYGIFEQRVYSLTHKGNCTNKIHMYLKP